MKKRFILMLEVMAMLSLFGCGSLKGENAKGIFAKANKNEIVSYEFIENNAFSATNTFYRLDRQNDVLIYTFQDESHPDYGEMSMQVDDEILTKIKEIYLAHKAYRFDGFSKVNTGVLDGGGFSMNMTFEDGETYHVHGTNCAPDNFYSYANEVNALFDSYNTQLLQQTKQKRIDKGVSGHLNDFMVSIAQYGNFGRSTYNIHAYKEDAHNSHISIRLNDVDDERFGASSISISRSVPTNELHLEVLEEMVKKYDMVLWIDYEEQSEDSNNREWFQINLKFEEGSIDAMGSKAPLNYNEFRDELEKYLVELVKTLQ